MDLEEVKNDLTEAEAESVQKYVSNGCPGLARIVDTDVFGWFELYMSGKTYSEIARHTKTKKDLVMYMSIRSQWHVKKMEYYNDLANNLINKYTQAKSKGLNTITSMVNALSTYYGDQFDLFLSTKNRDIIDKMDTKMLAQYYKSIEMLDKIMGTTNKDDLPTPAVNVNIGSNAKVKQVSDSEIDVEVEGAEISEENIGDILKFLAEKRKKEKEKG